MTGIGSAMPTEIIESKEIYRGFIALRLTTLRLVDGAARSSSMARPGRFFPMTPGRSLGPRSEFRSMDFLKLVPDPAGHLDSGLV